MNYCATYSALTKRVDDIIGVNLEKYQTDVWPQQRSADNVITTRFSVRV